MSDINALWIVVMVLLALDMLILSALTAQRRVNASLLEIVRILNEGNQARDHTIEMLGSTVYGRNFGVQSIPRPERSDN